jgi:signal transduction histidine kinase
LAFGGLLVLATGILLLLGHRATVAQERSDRQLADRRARETLALLIAALDRDMKGAQLSVLLQLGPSQFIDVSAADLASQASTAFGRFPYLETMFVWRSAGADRDRPYVLNRSDRPPPWDTEPPQAVAYPVVTRHGHAVIRGLVDRIRGDAPFTKRFAAYELTIAGVAYQLVVHLQYDTAGDRPDPAGIIGYMVNLDWVRQHYFAEIVTQVSAIAGEGQSTALSIADNDGAVVAATAASDDAPLRRRFPLTFFDARLTHVVTDRTPSQLWTAAAGPLVGASDPAAVSGQRLFMLMALAALASVLALAVIAHAMQARAEVAAMKADFVSTVTHELKTPLSLMRLVADSLVAGRYRDPEKVPKYGELLSTEVSRMTHLIDNLLAYARLSSVYDGHLAAPIDVAELLAAVTADWQPRLTQQNFTLDVAIDHEPMAVAGDRTALQQALNNLIDNSSKYAQPDGERRIALRARRAGSAIAIEVEDRGPGIHKDDLPLVREKFFRGRGTRVAGSGLGLAIVSRVVKNHGGSIDIRSREGGGTLVTVSLPAA